MVIQSVSLEHSITTYDCANHPLTSNEGGGSGEWVESDEWDESEDSGGSDESDELGESDESGGFEETDKTA